jgi:hypothetical protein
MRFRQRITQSELPLTASSQTVPRGLDVVSDPVINGLVVFRRVLDVLVDLAGVVWRSRATERLVFAILKEHIHTCARNPTDLLGLIHAFTSKTGAYHVDSDGEAVGENAFGSLNVDVHRRRGGRGVEVRVVGSQLATER